MITQLLSHDLAYAIAWTLVHSIWQITLVAALLSFILRLNKNKSPQAKYIISFASLGVIGLMSLVTFASYYNQDTAHTQAVIAGISVQLIEQSELSISTLLGLIDSYLFVIAYTWLLGCLLFIIKLIGGYTFIKRLAKTAIDNNESLNKKLLKLQSKFKIKRTIQLKESDRITTPMVVGFFKPIILFPIGLVNQLSGDEVAAILAHELAHIKRHDFLFNLIQSLAEAIYYFHPGIWYISACISKERENCCDDMAIQYTSSKVSYAKILIKLQELKLQNLEPAVAMAGKSSNFGQRIRRLLDLPVQGQQFREKFLAICLICFALVGFAKDSNTSTNVDPEEMDVYIIDDCPQDVEEIKYYVDTIPERNNFHVKRSSKEKDLELKMEDGEIVELKVDGETIPESDYDKMEDVIIEMIPDGKRDIITVFPDCGENFGNIYYLNKDKQIIVLDSILEDVTERMKEFENFKLDKFDFHSDKFNKIFIDSLRIEMGDIDWDQMNSPTLQIDSLLDLLPSKIPMWDESNFGLTLGYPDSHRSTILEKVSPSDEYPSKTIFKWKELSPESHISNINNSVADVISTELRRDRLISDDQPSKVELSGKKLKIDGEKQPTNIWKKYKSIYEKATGLELTKNSKIEIQVEPLPEEEYSKTIFKWSS